MKPELSTDLRIKAHISSLVKIRSVGAELFHADRQTDMTKLIVAFRNFANLPKSGTFSHTFCMRVPYSSHSQHRLFSYTVLTDSSL